MEDEKGKAHVFQYGAITFECFANTRKKSSHFLRISEINMHTIVLIF